MKVKFLSFVQHDAKLYAEGDTADLPAEVAKPLIACGAVEVFDAVAEKAKASSSGGQG